MPAPADLGPTSTDPASAEPAGTGPQRRRWRRGLARTVITLLVAALLSVLVRAYAYEAFFIPSASMVPTLAVYDRILVQKAFFNWHDVREGDIVVFTHPPLDRCPGPAGDLVKRVIALPGQTIYSAGNTIYINGHLLAEPYLPAAARPLTPRPVRHRRVPRSWLRLHPAGCPRPAKPRVRPGPRRTAASVTAAPCATGSREPVPGAGTTLRSDK
jgi:signal peptidase I